MTQGKSQNTEGRRGPVRCRWRRCSGSGAGGGEERRVESAPARAARPGTSSVTYQAEEHSALRHEGKGLHIEPLEVIRVGHGGADGMESGPVVVQVGRTAGRQGPGRMSATLAPDADPVFAQMQSPVTPSGLSLYLPPVHFT